jgi:hypothetical protein
MDGFQEALEDYQLGDLGYLGPRFACSNRRQYGSFTKKRLDRVVANLEWWSQFLVVSIHILAAKTSNHNPIFVEFFEQPAKPHSYKRSFKFEASWTTDEEWKDVVQSAWENCLPERDPMQDVQAHLSLCQQALSRWSWRKFGNEAEQSKRKTKQLAELKKQENLAVFAEIKRLQGEIDDILEREDI